MRHGGVGTDDEIELRDGRGGFGVVGEERGKIAHVALYRWLTDLKTEPTYARDLEQRCELSAVERAIAVVAMLWCACPDDPDLQARLSSELFAPFQFHVRRNDEFSGR